MGEIAYGLGQPAPLSYAGMRARRLSYPRERSVTATAEARLAPMLLVAAWGAVFIAVTAQAAAPWLVDRYVMWPLLVGIVVLGLPHGALDHLIPARTGFAWGRRPVPVALFLAAYAGLVAAYLGVWLLVPAWAFAGFLLATIWHWGQGDQRFLEIFLGRRPRPGVAALVTVLTRGSMPILVPIAAFPAAAQDLFVRATSGLGLEVAALDLSAPWLRLLILAVLAGLSVSYLLVAIDASATRAGLLVDVAEVALLAGFFVFVPAYAAIGIYFVVWHSLRHLARLSLLRRPDAEAIGRGELAGPVRRLAVDLIPVTAAALALLASLTMWSRANLQSVDDFVAVYLVLISALTVPHMIVVAMMDATPRLARTERRADA